MKTASLPPLTFAAVLLLLSLAACATHHAVRCDAKLTPINAPHPKPHPEPAK